MNDLRCPSKRKEQLPNIMAILSESLSEVWKERYYKEYVCPSEDKFTATTSGTLTTANTCNYKLFGDVTAIGIGLYGLQVSVTVFS